MGRCGAGMVTVELPIQAVGYGIPRTLLSVKFSGYRGCPGPLWPPSPRIFVPLGLPPSSHSCITPSGSQPPGLPPGPKRVTTPRETPPASQLTQAPPPAPSCPWLISPENMGPQIWNWLPQGPWLVRPSSRFSSSQLSGQRGVGRGGSAGL